MLLQQTFPRLATPSSGDELAAAQRKFGNFANANAEVMELLRNGVSAMMCNN